MSDTYPDPSNRPDGPLKLTTLSKQLAHEIEVFEKTEVYRFYVGERRKHCTLFEIMNLWLLVPYCYDCALNESYEAIVDSLVRPDNWADALRSHVGDEVVTQTEAYLRDSSVFAFSCKRCQIELRPWEGDEISVGRIHVEERFAIPMEIPGRKKPPHDIARLIKRYYDFRCFGCGELKSVGGLHIDHIFPQSQGGTSAFRNLQPLCHQCGTEKADSLPEEVDVCSTIFFGPSPSDSYEGFFW